MTVPTLLDHRMVASKSLPASGRLESSVVVT